MAQTQRMYDFSAGTKAKSQDVDDELNNLVTAHNTLDTDVQGHKNNAVLDHPDQSVTTAKIKDGNITTVKIADGNVTTAKIADLNVTTQKIADLNVTTGKITDNAITTSKIADGHVITSKLADNAVTTSKISQASVTANKLSDDVYSVLGGIVGSSLNTNEYTWTATEGQQTFVLPANASYVPGYKRLYAEVGGSTQHNVTETSSTSFTVAEPLPAGTIVFAKWYEGAFSSQAHRTSHYAGASDELNIADLAGFNELDERLNVIESSQGNNQQGPWIAPTLINNWVNYGDTDTGAGYFKDNFGFVHLQGMIKGGVIGSNSFILPDGYRPLKIKRFAVVSNGLFGSVYIGSDGVVTMQYGSSSYVSLEGISFRVEQ